MEAEHPGQQVSQSFLEQFNSLQKSGALDDLALLRNENRVLDSLINDAAALYVLTSIEDMMSFMTDRILQQFIPTYLLVMIEPPHGQDLRQFCYANLKPSGESLSAQAYAALKERFSGSTPYLADYDSLPLDRPVKDELARFNPDIVVPLTGIEGVYGSVVLVGKVLGGPYSDLERMYVDKLMRFISIAVQNNLHHEGAITDPKTGLYNHGYFMQRLEGEIARVERHGVKAGIIMLDVDLFKKFNDTWGHLAGDEVLTSLAQTIKQAIRTEDVAARFGGEEFCALIIECDTAKVIEVAERIRASIQAMKVKVKGADLSVTASFGCCVVDPELPAKASDYIERADKALYLSKSGGRNRTSLYKPGLLDRARAIRMEKASSA